MKENYCIWMVAPGEAAEKAKATVASARASGVFKDFHIWTDAPEVEGASCHPLGRFDPAGGIFRFTYLRDAVISLNYEHYVWMEPGTEFVRNPGSILRVLHRAPLHVPLTFDVANDSVANEVWGGTTCGKLAQLMQDTGVHGRFVFAAYGGFFVVHRHVVKTFCKLAFDFWQRADREGVQLTFEPLLAYGAQMLTGDPRRHHISHAKDLWLPRHDIDLQHESTPALVGCSDLT